MYAIYVLLNNMILFLLLLRFAVRFGDEVGKLVHLISRACMYQHTQVFIQYQGRPGKAFK